MRKMVRATAFVALVMSLVMVTSCGGGTGEGEALSEAAYDLIWYNIGTPQKDTQLVVDAINEITVPEIGVRLDMRYIDWGDYSERMKVIIASGQPFDIAFTSSWANDFVSNVQRGAFLPLNELLKNEGQALYEAVYPPYWEAAAIDGRIYGVPANKELGQQEVYIFNKEVLDRFGFELADSYAFEELEPMLAEVHAKEPHVVAYNINNQQDPFPPFDFVLGRYIPAAFEIAGDDGRVVNPYETEEMHKELSFLRHYYRKGYIPAEAPMTEEKQGYNSDANPDWFVRRAAYQPYAENIFRGLYGVDVVVRPVNEHPYINTESALGSLQAISVTSERPEKAMEFLNLVNTDSRVRNLLAFGIEGTHYTLTEEGKMAELDRIDDYRVPDFTLGNLYVSLIKDGEPSDKWDRFRQYNASGITMPSLGFFFDNTNVRTEIASISNISQEYLPALYTGGVEVEEYVAQYNRRLAEAGLDRVIEEIQSQYDAWKASGADR